MLSWNISLLAIILSLQCLAQLSLANTKDPLSIEGIYPIRKSYKLKSDKQAFRPPARPRPGLDLDYIWSTRKPKPDFNYSEDTSSFDYYDEDLNQGTKLSFVRKVVIENLKKYLLQYIFSALYKSKFSADLKKRVMEHIRKAIRPL